MQLTLEGLAVDTSAQGNRRVMAYAASPFFSFTEEGPDEITLHLGLPGAISTLTDRLVAPRYGASIAALGDGRIALVGGASGPFDSALASSDLLDDGTWSLHFGLLTPSFVLQAPRVHALTSTLTARGASGDADYQWLIVAGGDHLGRLWMAPTSTTARTLLVPRVDTGLEQDAPPQDVIRYDFRWNEQKALTPLQRPSILAPSVTLSTGMFYYCGGLELAAPDAQALTPARLCWLYNPQGEGLIQGTSALPVPALFHTLTLLPDDEVLITGGIPQLELTSGSFTAQATLFSAPELRMREARTLITPRAAHSSVLLAQSKTRVLITGGYGSDGSGGITLLKSAEYFDRIELEEGSSRVFSSVGASLSYARAFHSMLVLEDGRVLVAGGIGEVPGQPLPLEIFDPETPSLGFVALPETTLPPLLLARLIPMPNGDVAILGGVEVGSDGEILGTSEDVRIFSSPR